MVKGNGDIQSVAELLLDHANPAEVRRPMCGTRATTSISMVVLKG